MGAKSAIEWTDATWTPLRARVKADAAAIAQAKGYASLVQIAEKMAGHVGPHCEHVSHGCDNCYAETNNGRCLPANGTGLPFDRRSRDLVDTFLDEKILLQPLHWRTPRRVFVCSQTDLFGEWVSTTDILTLFHVMAKCPTHTFQILTKRPERMQALLSARRWRKFSYLGGEFYAALIPGEHRESDSTFLPNVHLGVSVEDQPTANARIPELLRTPAAIRFISYEPALGTVDLNAIPVGGSGEEYDPVVANVLKHASIFAPHIHWVICGGESGPGARPMHPDWARSVRDQCVSTGVPFFFKQWGEFCDWYQLPEDSATQLDAAGVIPKEIPQRVGKKLAGRLLDGVEHNGFPEVAR